MGLAVDGLSSGLDTTALLNGLMQVEAIPQNILKNKASGTQTMVTALQQLNSRIASLATLAKDTAKPAALDLFTAKTTSDSATATISTGASAASLSFTVEKLAQTQVSVTDAMTAWPDTAITIGGKAITAASTSLDDMVKAINESDAGVTALKVASGTNVNGDPQYRLQLTSNTSGAAGAFTVSVPTTEVTKAQDAEIKLWAGTPAAQSITSSTNNFENVLPGVTVAVKAISTDPVTLTVARDSAASAKVAEDWVGAVNGVLAMIATRTVVTNSTDSSGKPVMSKGVFTGDSTVRMVNQKILSAATAPVNGVSPSSIGVSITKTGTIEFDQAKFDQAFAADPAKVKSVMQGLSERVAAAATEVSDKYDGMLTSKITGQESLVKNLNTQISGWDNRLASRRATLERTFVAMEVRLSSLNSQSAWLTSQLSSLSPGKDK
jgi:flagellar hook-associated protein 2